MTIHLSSETAQVLDTAKVMAPASFLLMTPSPRACRETRAIVTSLLARHLTRPLKSQAFLEQLGIFGDSHVDGLKGE
jgi:hypothetical protein